MTKTSKIVKTILLSAILIGVTFTLSNIQSAYAQPPLFGLAHTAGPSTLYTINTSTGVATPVGPVGFNRCSGMDFDASGTLFAACNRSSDGINVLITINTSTGAGIEIGTTGSEAFQTAGRFGIISDISFRNSDGVLFGYGGPDGPLFTINTATGAVTQVGPFPTSPVESGNALAFSATDTLFYIEIDPPVLNTLSPLGVKTVLGSINVGCCSGQNHRVNAADFDQNGVLFGSLNAGAGGTRSPIHLVTITTTPSFVATSIGITVEGLDAIAFGPAPPDKELTTTTADGLGIDPLGKYTFGPLGPEWAGSAMICETVQPGWTPIHPGPNCIEITIESGGDLGEVVPDDVTDFGNLLVITSSKSWTHTDYNWEGNTEIPDDDVLADELPTDDDGKFLVNGNVHPKNNKFQNTNPGAFYAVTTVEVLTDIDGLWVEELYEDCTVTVDDTHDPILKLLAPNAKPERAVKVAIADSNDDVTELTDDLNDGVGGFITADNTQANVHIEQSIEAGSTVYVLVKFQHNLKGEVFLGGDVNVICHNEESVTASIDGLPDASVDVDADLRITNQE